MNKLVLAAVATPALGAAATSPAYAGINMRFLGRFFPLGANARHVSFAKLARAATLLAAGILASASSGWTDPAVAQTFRVDVSGTFTSGTPFTVSFLVNTNAAPVLHDCALRPRIRRFDLGGDTLEALASLAVSPAGCEIRTQPLRSLAPGAAKVRFYLARFDAASGVLCHKLRHH